MGVIKNHTAINVISRVIPFTTKMNQPNCYNVVLTIMI